MMLFMLDSNDVIMVFTSASPDRIIRQGGSQAWVLNLRRARAAKWLICTQNDRDRESSDATEPHGSGFLVGRISGLRLALQQGGKRRYMIEISDFARIQYPDLWDGKRFPVRYTSFDRLGISVEGIDFQPVPNAGTSHNIESVGNPEQARPDGTRTLTIAEAKQGLAATFGVEPEAVEITIRG
jgi:hypothetical protein